MPANLGSSALSSIESLFKLSFHLCHESAPHSDSVLSQDWVRLAVGPFDRFTMLCEAWRYSMYDLRISAKCFAS